MRLGVPNAPTSARRASACLIALSALPAQRPERRGVLQGQDHQPGDRLLGRRRLRPLRPASRPPHGQAHPRQSDHRAAEHAGRRQPAAANFIYTAAPKDGTAFGTFARTTGINPLLESGATFDGTKFSWLGSVTDDVSLCVTWHTSPVKTWNDFLKKPITLGGQGPSSEPDIFARLYKNVFDAPIKLVAGYPGTNEIALAMERGEVDGLCGLSWSTIKTRHAQWLKDKKINLIVQASFKKVPELGRRAAGDGADQGHREAADPQAHPGGAGDGAAVRGAARHSGRPQGRAGRRRSTPP